MKKNTTKKTTAKSNRKSAPTAKKQVVSVRAKKVTGSAPRTTKLLRKPGTVGTKADLRKAAPPTRPQEIQRGLSENGKAQWQDNHKAKKTQDKAEPAAAKPAAPPPPTSPPEPKVKTYLSSKELKEFKALLLAKRAELAGDVENLTTQALNRKTDGVNEPSFMPIHMADLGSDTWEQDFTLGLIANEQALVREIDEALARIEDRTYGMCIATDKPISKQRLLAKPWAKYCIEYARLREEGRAP